MLRSQLDRTVFRIIVIVLIIGACVGGWTGYHSYLRHSLIQAAQVGDTDRVADLLARGVDPNSSEADPNFTSPQPNSHETEVSALEWALRNHHPAAALALLQKGAIPRTASIISAAAEPDTRVGLALLDHGVDGGTLLSDAAFVGNAELMRALLTHTPALKAAAESKAMLCDAASKANLAVIDALLDCGIDINSRDATGATALMRAAMVGQTQVITVLLRRGADVHAVNSLGRTARDYAVMQRQPEAERALAAAEQGGQAGSDGVDQQRRRATLYANMGRADEAVESLRQLLARKPGDLQTRSALIRALWQHKEPQAARQTAEEGVQLAPHSARAYTILGTICTWQNDLTAAAAAYRTALQIDPHATTIRSYLAFVLERQGDLTAAIRETRTLVAEAPTTPAWHYALGTRLYSQGDRDGAVGELRRAVALAPRLGGAYVTLGWILLEQGKIPEAVTTCKQAVDLLPNDANAHANYGKALTAQGDLAGALEQCRLALRLDPSDAEAHYNLGFALDKQGLRPQAIAELRTYLSFVRRNPNEAARVTDAEQHLQQWGARIN
jgi:Flp pilus assembly protein TadD